MSHRVIDGGMASPSTASTAPTGMPEQNRANDNSLLLQRDNTTSQNEDSASLSSSNGRGYAADCSSSDSSSDVSSRQKQNQGEAQPTINEDKTIPGVDLTSDDANQTKDGTSLDGLRSPSFKKGTNDKTKAELHSGSEKGKVSSHVVAKIGALDDLVNQHRTTEPPVFLPGDRGQLPQWNGVRIMHPMDPRIDLSSVGHLTQVPVPVSDSKFAGNGMVVGAAAPPLENYLHLMEAVKPFFLSHGFPLPHHTFQTPPQDGETQEEPSSSEGFTSFFTSTEKSSSDSNSDPKQQPESQHAAAHQVTENEARNDVVTFQQQAGPPLAPPNAPPDESDSSSMVVLARVKRKHQRRHQPPQGEQAEQDDATQAAVDTANQRRQQAESPDQESKSSSSQEAVQPIRLQAQHAAEDAGHRNLEQQLEQQPRAHIISESSDSLRGRNGFSSTTHTATTNTSGSGSGGNSGSNPGSSGSGNDVQNSSGSGNEKGSSTDAAKDDNSGGEVNSNCRGHEVGRTQAVGDNIAQTPSSKTAASQQHLTSNSKSEPTSQAKSEAESGATREQKLIDKKRKRMNMRREYEEQFHQQNGSSESSQSAGEVSLRPGRPVTLDVILSFTKTARLVVQAGSPFLVVHANAAYAALTGIDSHFAVGKPVRTLLSLPESSVRESLAERASAEGMSSASAQSSLTNSASVGAKPTKNKRMVATAARQQQKDSSQKGFQSKEDSTVKFPEGSYAAAAAVGRARAVKHQKLDVSVERLVVASGFGQAHTICAAAKSHHLLGRNVTVIRKKRDREHPDETERSEKSTAHSSKRDDARNDHGSQSSSLPSNEDSFYSITCQMCVSPVVSSTQSLDATITTEQDAESKHSKRRKNTFHHRRSSSKGTLVTHYVIQLFSIPPSENSRKQERCQESWSSTSGLGSREEATHGASEDNPYDAPQNGEDDDMDEGSEPTDPQEPLPTIG